MQSWYLWSLAALLLIGFQRFIYKIAAEQKIPAFVLTFAFMASVALISTTLTLIQAKPLKGFSCFLLLALINSLGFVLATLAHIRALYLAPASKVYPLIRLNILLVVFFSWAVLEESLSIANGVGIVLALIGAWILTTRTSACQSEHQGPGPGSLTSKISPQAWFMIVVAMVCGAISSISCKFAAEILDNFLAFIALSYFISSCLLLPLAGRQFVERYLFISTLGYGLLMGVLNLAGFYAYLKALSQGPLSLVAMINGQHFVLAVLLSWLIYKEPMNKNSILGLLLICISLILLT